MKSTFKTFLDHHDRITKEDNLYYQKDFARQNEFEKAYTALRSNEQRLYPDHVVLQLPAIKQHSLEKEWRLRTRSAEKLAAHIRNKKAVNILEVGCGNGWFLNYLNSRLAIDCCGIDINEIELRQAASLFPNISFVYGDIRTSLFRDNSVDIILLASVIQYFEKLQPLLVELNRILTDNGEIHIVDSPIYENQASSGRARERSGNYFETNNAQKMQQFYFHHTWSELCFVSHTILEQPKKGFARIFTSSSERSPFPWIKILKGKGETLDQ
jgi:ubiquinone/menaquinone biosynthesis C-methylase UbiE